MAQRVVTLYTDDITGNEGEDIATHTFSVDGVTYEIDLGEDSYQQLLDALGPFVRAGRKIGGSSRRGGSKRAQADGHGPDAAKVREWAQAQGIEINARGRIPGDVLEKYQAAN
ncbi:Lsr2 family protein [Streptomyces sp. So13.3]|uniref:histone-like nucleoid-structuring protein Lsr2 n=1 Tax=Streptomyces sp. So13.3 TaxID=2136173 RepID=UPI001106C31A|nr:Lsr2 family protein [Streptomyces sp. So13.3]QNA75372.1 Lsr2 family protein [Streptomyces sp. So13.3]